MPGELDGRRVAILAADGVERVELEQPRYALDRAGAGTTLLSIHDGEIAARNHDLEDAGTFTVDRWSATCHRTTSTRWSCRAARSTRTSCA